MAGSEDIIRFEIRTFAKKRTLDLIHVTKESGRPNDVDDSIGKNENKKSNTSILHRLLVCAINNCDNCCRCLGDHFQSKFRWWKSNWHMDMETGWESNFCAYCKFISFNLYNMYQSMIFDLLMNLDLSTWWSKHKSTV